VTTPPPTHFQQHLHHINSTQTLQLGQRCMTFHSSGHCGHAAVITTTSRVEYNWTKSDVWTKRTTSQALSPNSTDVPKAGWWYV